MSLFDWFANRRKSGPISEDHQEREIADGLWTKCEHCDVLTYTKDLRANQWVCGECGHHHRIFSDERIRQLVDPGTWQPLDTQILPRDPLNFKDRKAYADRLRGSDRTIFVVMSDGELQEGSVWEALMLAPSLKTTRLVALIDVNDFQSLGRTSETLPNFYPVLEKLWAFGWEAAEVNGHDAAAVYRAVTSRVGDRPFALVGRTVKGRGVRFMENVPVWHYRSPNPEEFKTAMAELREVAS